MTAADYLTVLYQTRRERLQSLVRTFDSIKDAAKEIGLSEGRISNLLHKNIPFTEKTARGIEGCFGLEMGSLDQEIVR